MQITGSGLKRPEIQEINIESFGENVTILDEHLRDTDIHVNASKIAEIAEPDELTQINSTDTNSTMWGKIKKSISVLNDHVEEVASETTLGHIKIGTGLQMIDDVASVKIANDLVTEDVATALSANMGVLLNKNLEEHEETVATGSDLGHIKIGTGLQMQDGKVAVKIANDLTTNDATTALSAAMGVELVNTLISKVYPVGSIYMSVNNASPADFIGGTWTALKDRFLIGAGGSYGVNTTGGETKHTLTVDEIPNHSHSYSKFDNVIIASNGTYFSSVWWDSAKEVNTSAIGGGQAHNNMPPYLGIYMWKRIK